MKSKLKLAAAIVILAAIIVVPLILTGGDVGEIIRFLRETEFAGTYWALLPPVAAIVLALLTQEVYSSLFIGMLVGALLYCNFSPIKTLETVFEEGFLVVLGDDWNAGILIFLVTLGIIVALMSRSGGSAAYGKWAAKHIKSKKGAAFATFGLAVALSVDDYFNSLTTGYVMRPVTDQNKISRAKLTYIIDSTAAPMCMIMPISSWAAAVSSNIETSNGMEIFLKAIPFNFYSLLTLTMIILTTALNVDFGPMRVHEINAANGDLFTTDARPFAEVEDEDMSHKGKVIDLVLPVIVLISCCICGMIYTGGFFSGESFANAFANCNASLGLAMGSLVALLVCMLYFICRRLMSFGELMECVPSGFKAMVPAMLILVFAWSLSEMTGHLGAGEYVAAIFASSAKSLRVLLPIIVFLVSIGLAFATGSSWGTMGILLPIVAQIQLDDSLFIIAVSACLAGAVCGDHCSPISDTTVMSSTGARCDYINHIATQLPYALFVAAISAVGYLIAGLTESVWLSLPTCLAILAAILVCIKLAQKKREKKLS